jgi:DNA-directed RNA polymerase subunit RPC12/RpoP
MSDFKFLCPKCKQSIACDTSNAGMNVACPSCGANITVPKPPEPEPVPGKLAIRHSAPHAPAAPASATANAPKPTSWGGKPAAAPPPPKKAAWVKPVAIIGGVLVALAIGWFGFGAPYLKKQADEARQKQEEADRQAKAAADAAAAAAALKAAKARIVWTMDATAEIPQFAAAGKIHGVNFKVESVVFQNGVVKLTQTNPSVCQISFSLPAKTMDAIAGKSFNYLPNDTNESNRPPAVNLVWKEETSKTFGKFQTNKDYLLKLEFGDKDNGNVPGGIYLCLPDAEQSFVAGTFVATPPLLPGQKPPVVAAKSAPRKKK